MTACGDSRKGERENCERRSRPAELHTGREGKNVAVTMMTRKMLALDLVNYGCSSAHIVQSILLSAP